MKNKRFISNLTKIIAIAGVMLCGIITSSADAKADEVSGFWKYKINDGKAAITDYTGAELNVKVPSKLGGYDVKVIGYNVFAENIYIETVDIPSSIETIGYFIFYQCSDLKKVTGAASVTSIEYKAFENCTSLESYSFTGKVKSIGEGAFRDCSSLKSVNLTASDIKCGYEAFSGCNSLTVLTLPKNFNIGGASNIFMDCDNLVMVRLNAGADVGRGGFENCVKLKTVVFEDGVDDIRDF